MNHQPAAQRIELKCQPRPLARRSRIQRVQGIETEDKAWQLYVKGIKQVQIANQLSISPTRVSRYLSRRMSRIEESAPQAPEELAVLREIVNARLEAIYEEAARKPPCPQSLSVQLKCLAQMAALNGLNLECRQRRTSPPPSQPPATPQEIAEAVRARIQTA